MALEKSCREALRNHAGASTNGAFAFDITCPFGRAMRIDSSTNLANWTVLANLITTNATMAVRDPAAVSSKNRFYRVTMQ